MDAKTGAQSSLCPTGAQSSLCRKCVQYCIDALLTAGAHKAQCVLHQTEKHELNVVAGEISLLRTTYDTQLSLTSILDQKQGSVTINQLDQVSLDNSIQEVIALTQSSTVDPAYDIAEQQAPKEFFSGPESPDLDRMYDKLARYLAYCQTTYPNTMQEEVNFDFTLKHTFLQNSNGVDFSARQGLYNFMTMFTSKEGKDTSSFNATGFSTKSFDDELHEYGTVNTLLKQSGEQVRTQPLAQPFTGDLIITPDCLEEFIEFITGYLRDYALISGNSIFKDQLQNPIASEKFTLHSCPMSEEIADGYFFTHDGYEAQNSPIIQDGILQTFLLSLYGSRKTNRARAVNEGGAYIIEPGATPADNMIKSVYQGVLLSRFSGGNPSENGDFSGVAKNSYYIERGEILYPLRETMISGNLLSLLKNIRHISQERINFGRAILPWMQVSNINISGK